MLQNGAGAHLLTAENVIPVFFHIEMPYENYNDYIMLLFADETGVRYSMYGLVGMGISRYFDRYLIGNFPLQIDISRYGGYVKISKSAETYNVDCVSSSSSEVGAHYFSAALVGIAK